MEMLVCAEAVAIETNKAIKIASAERGFGSMGEFRCSSEICRIVFAAAPKKRRRAFIERQTVRSPLKHRKEHQTVNHSRGEYQHQNQDGSRNSTHTAESFFLLLKRAIIGAW